MELVSKQYITKENLDVSHNNTILSQLLSLIPRHVFTQTEREHPTERKARIFNRWNQFVCLSFIHLAARHSMRDGIGVTPPLGQKCTLSPKTTERYPEDAVEAGTFLFRPSGSASTYSRL